MDVQQGGGNSDPGAGPAGGGQEPRDGSRVGLIVGIGLALLLGLVAVVVLLSRDDDTTASEATPTPTSTVTVTVDPGETPTPTAEPTEEPTPTTPETPPTGEFPDLMADSLGPLELRMAKDEALATGLVTEQEFDGQVELIADPGQLPGVFICWDSQQDSLTSFTVKDGSPITTPDGIGVGSTATDLRAAYGVLLQELEEAGMTWFTVPVDDVGYAFFPTEVEMIMLAGTDQVVADVRPGSEPC
jgi:hypothetical protein